MSENATMSALYAMLILIIPIAALAARRVPMGQMARMALIWVGVFAALFAMVSLWRQFVPA